MNEYVKLKDVIEIFKEYVMEYKDYIVGNQETQEMWSNTAIDYIKRFKSLSKSSSKQTCANGEKK